MMVMMEPMAMIFIDRSFWVRTTLASVFLLSFPWRQDLRALLMMPHERTMPMMPAMAMPPMPILLAYSAKMVSGDIEPTVCVIAGFQAFNTWSPHSKAMPGTMIIHTASEPAQIMAAYFNPTIYPSPKTAAPVLILSTNFALSAIVSPSHTRGW